MSFQIKKIFLSLLTNSFFFLLMIIGIQNSSHKARFNLLVKQTIPLPISFIIGTSFLSGTFIGSIIPIGNTREN